MKKYKFKAKIEAGDGGEAYVLFPYDTVKEFVTNGKMPHGNISCWDVCTR